MNVTYATPPGGLPSQSDKMTGRAIFKESYAFMPAGVMRDIVTSNLPHWENTRAWIIARPMTGFVETFAQYIVEVGTAGGSDNPEPDPHAEAVLFVVAGQGKLTIDGQNHAIKEGGYAYIPPSAKWSIKNQSDTTLTFHWIRKRYDAVEGIDTPTPFFTNEQDVAPNTMANTDDWSTTRFVEPDDLRHDM
ncbi:MAG: cupin domain-containing protein, partial [Pseudomonadota bacterium]